MSGGPRAPGAMRASIGAAHQHARRSRRWRPRRSTIPTIRPSSMTATRSPTARTSSSSVLTIRIAAPASRCSTIRRWMYSIEPDVEAAGGLGGDDELDGPRELPRDDDLLLVAARQRAGRRCRSTGVRTSKSLTPCGRAVVDRLRGRGGRRWLYGCAVVGVQDEVLGDRHGADQPVAHPVLGDVGDAQVRDVRAGDAVLMSWPSMRDLARSPRRGGRRWPRRARSGRCPGRLRGRRSRRRGPRGHVADRHVRRGRRGRGGCAAGGRRRPGGRGPWGP